MKNDLKILYVEDSDFQREASVLNLEHLGFENITEMTNGARALSYLRNNAVDLIISDWKMPEMNGLELLKKVREDPSLKNIPFIMITVDEDESNLALARQAGVTDFIGKPTPAQVLKEVIEKIFP